MHTDAWMYEWEAPQNVTRGESHHQDAIERAAGNQDDRGVPRPVVATLRREPTNAYDPNAIRVEVNGELVGRITKELAVELAPRMDRAGIAMMEVPAVVCGGASRMHLGVHLWLTRRITPTPSVGVDAAVLLPYSVSWPPTEQMER
jgi:hypothetical protein